MQWRGIGQTVPFHFIWISLTLIYGFRSWRLVTTLVVLGLVCGLTGFGLLLDVVRDGLDWAELTEVPLMAAVFLVMAWHVSRRRAALAQVHAYAREQEVLREKERQFLRDVSHLFRTPLTVARGYVELIRAGAEEPDLHHDASVVLRELDSLSRISARLLLLRATDLSAFVEPVRLDVADLLQDLALRWGPSANRTWRVHAESCLVRADEALLESALDALIENALRFTRDGGEVCLSCRREGGTVTVLVQDDGTGIEPVRMPQLFRRPDHVTTATAHSGTGLGLPLVKAIVEAHGGSVHAQSSRGGSVFELTLPAVD
jgi:two-component system, OmpR family, sensor kinase